MNVNGVQWTDEPWLPYRATAHLSTLKVTSAFEWGCGGSTIWLKEVMGVRYLESVEHDPAWFDAVRTECSHRGVSVKWHLYPPEKPEIGPDKANPDHYKSGSTELGPCNFRAYASFIDVCGEYDLVLVDGMARVSCLKHAVPHVRPGGCLVLDNTDRPYYLQNTLSLFDGWERIDFTGYGPILAYQWRCTVFHNTRKQDYEDK